MTPSTPGPETPLARDDHPEIVATINRADPTELVALVNRLMGELQVLSVDLDYHESILSGSWPSARQILTDALAKCPAEIEVPRDLQS